MHDQTKKELNLEELTQVEEAGSLKFLSSGLVVEFYDVKWTASGYRLLFDDPWISEQNYVSSKLVGTSIGDAAHYHIGHESHEGKAYKTRLRIIMPIVFFKKK